MSELTDLLLPGEKPRVPCSVLLLQRDPVSLLCEAWQATSAEQVAIVDAAAGLVPVVRSLLARVPPDRLRPCVGSMDSRFWREWYLLATELAGRVGTLPLEWMFPHYELNALLHEEKGGEAWLEALSSPDRGEPRIEWRSVLEAAARMASTRGFRHDHGMWSAWVAAVILRWVGRRESWGELAAAALSLRQGAYATDELWNEFLAYLAGRWRNGPLPRWLLAEVWRSPNCWWSLVKRCSVPSELLDPSLGCPVALATHAGLYLREIRHHEWGLRKILASMPRPVLFQPMGGAVGLRVNEQPLVLWLEEVRWAALQEAAGAQGIAVPPEAGRAIPEAYATGQAAAEDARRDPDRGTEVPAGAEPRASLPLPPEAENALGRWVDRGDERLVSTLCCPEVLGEYLPLRHVVHLYGPMIRLAARGLLAVSPGLAGAAQEHWHSHAGGASLDPPVDPLLATSEALAWIVLVHEIGHAVWYSGWDMRGERFRSPKDASVTLHETLAQAHVAAMLREPGRADAVPWPVQEVFETLVPRQPWPYRPFGLLGDDGEVARSFLIDLTRRGGSGRPALADLLQMRLDEIQGCLRRGEPVAGFASDVELREALGRAHTALSRAGGCVELTRPAIESSGKIADATEHDAPVTAGDLLQLDRSLDAAVVAMLRRITGSDSTDLPTLKALAGHRLHDPLQVVARARQALLDVWPTVQATEVDRAELLTLIRADELRYPEGPRFSVEAFLHCQRVTLRDTFRALSNHPVLDREVLEQCMQRRRETPPGAGDTVSPGPVSTPSSGGARAGADSVDGVTEAFLAYLGGLYEEGAEGDPLGEARLADLEKCLARLQTLLQKRSC